jgi:NADH-quinone oxidoreductase subunit M
MNSIPWLTLLLVVPVGTVLVLQLLPRRATTLIKAVTVAGTLANAAMVAGLLVAFNRSPGTQAYALPQGGSHAAPLTFQFQEFHTWVPAIGAGYHVGIDGLSAWLLALDAGLFLLGALVVSSRDTERLKLFCGLLLLAESATMGVLLSLDLLLFYFFWEGMLIPLYFLLGFWGGPERGRATLKFVVYTVAGSLLMLLSIIYIYFDQTATATGHLTFDLQALILNPTPTHDVVGFSAFGQHVSLLLTPRQFAFVGFALAFLIKVPIFPFHTWLPDSYVNAPVAVLVFFAGIVGKLGAFAFVRYALTLFPGPVQDFHYVIAALAVISIIYGALLALSQRDIKRMVAYASMSHLGYIVLGIFVLNANGLNGSILQIVNHGIIIAALFLIVAMIEARTGTRDIRELGGLEKRMPWFYAFFLVTTLAALSMPGTNGFAGEFTILLGAFTATWALAAFALIGTLLAAWYMLRLHQGVMHQPLVPRGEAVRDIRFTEGLILAPLVALMILLGVFPKPVGDISKATVNQYVSIATGAQPTLGAPQAAAPRAEAG